MEILFSLLIFGLIIGAILYLDSRTTKSSEVVSFKPEKKVNIEDYDGFYDGGHNKFEDLFSAQTKQNNSTDRIKNDMLFDLNKLTISSTHPCLVIFLVDQSGSMNERFGNIPNSTKAIEVANAVNNQIYEMGLRCLDSNGEIKNRFEIAIIGYGIDIDIVKSGWEGQLAGKWVVSIRDVFENPYDFDEDKPIWIVPRAKGNTPMVRAFENAKRLCRDWINWGYHVECHPPIIINISDGIATDDNSSFTRLFSEVEQIKRLKTFYGPAMVLNIHISTSAGESILFPSTFNINNKYAKLLFNLSSPLTPSMIRIARQKGYNVDDHARGYVFNGNATDLVNFLNIGTPY